MSRCPQWQSWQALRRTTQHFPHSMLMRIGYIHVRHRDVKTGPASYPFRNMDVGAALGAQQLQCIALKPPPQQHSLKFTSEHIEMGRCLETKCCREHTQLSHTTTGSRRWLLVFLTAEMVARKWVVRMGRYIYTGDASARGMG